MAEEEKNNAEQGTNNDDSYKSVNADQIAALKVGENVWNFNGQELQKYPAFGEASVETIILDRVTRDETGAVLIHIFKWTDSNPFVKHQSAFSTTLRRVGRSSDQEIDSTRATPINAALYAEIITGGVIRVPKGNAEFDDIPKSRDEMLEFARIYPESASEAIENWLDAGHVELIDESNDSFDWMFQTQSVVKVFWWLGEKDNPIFAAILTFKAPHAERRNEFDKDVQKIKSRKQGEINVAQLSESFVKKVQYGSQHLQSVEGVLVGPDGVDYSEKLKQVFITNFNPIWFVDATEAMHESFDFTKGKAVAS
jgi:hypothetical protein